MKSNNENDNLFSGKKLLITGGTGSFGNAAVSRFLNTDIKEIRIFSRDEKKQDDMRNLYRNEKLKFYIGDVRDYNSILYAIRGVDYIFHAAALKQIPSCEFYPLEAIKTNILGVNNVLNAAIENDVKKVIVLSTDKAVYPINAMGMSKALMEKIMIAKTRMICSKKIVICGTRYGNIIASRGSIIPLFIDQIKLKIPFTVTDLNMTRFIMPIKKAIDLVLYAFINGYPGDIFIQKSPSCTIDVLLKAIKEIFNADNDVKIIGTRHGEKLYETLITREEMIKAEDLGDYYRIPVDSRNLNYDKYFIDGHVCNNGKDDYNSNNTTILNVDEVKKILLNEDYIIKELKEIGVTNEL